MRAYSHDEIKKILDGKNLLVASCEAGAAQMLSSLIMRLDRCERFTFVLENPAQNIFNSKMGALHLKDFSSEAFANKDFVLTGTSLVPELERRAIQMAKEQKIRVVSVIDHWAHYRQRFLPAQGKSNSDLDHFLPDEIWVCDEYAARLAIKEGLPEGRLRLISNYYLLDLKEKVAGLLLNPRERILLYICEPVFDDLKLLHGDGNIWGYNEFDLVNDFLSHVKEFEGRFDRVVLRLHPNEPIDKYKQCLLKYEGKLPLEISNYQMKSIEQECAEASAIVGVESMGLVVGLLLKKPTFSCLPASAKKECSLPHKEIIRIRSVSELAKHFDKPTIAV